MKEYASPVGGRAPESISIAYRQDSRARRSISYIATAITDALSRWNGFDLGHLCFERERGAKSFWQAYIRRWVQSIQRDPWPYHIEMRFWQAKDSGAIGSM